MGQKTTLPWDLQHAMSAFQVDPGWYEKYWLAPETHTAPPKLATTFPISDRANFATIASTCAAFGRAHLNGDGSVDIRTYLRIAEQERRIAMRSTFSALVLSGRRFTMFVKFKLLDLITSPVPSTRPARFPARRRSK
jgi:hypothetical protein